MFANPHFPHRTQQRIKWPPICMGCGQPKQKNLQSFVFHLQKKNLIKSYNIGPLINKTYAVFDMDVSAFLCESCYLRQRKSYNIKIGVKYPLFYGSFFLFQNIVIGALISATALLIGLIMAIIFYGVYYLIFFFYLRKNFQPTKSLIELKIDKYDLSFKFKSPRYALTFRHYNPGQKVI